MRVHPLFCIAVAAASVLASAPAHAGRLSAKDGGKVGNKYLGGKWSAEAWIENGATANGFGAKADAKLLLLTKEFNGFQGEAKVVGATSRKPGEIVLFAKVAKKTLVNERNPAYLNVSKTMPPLALDASYSFGLGPLKIGLAAAFSADASASLRAEAKLLFADAYTVLAADAKAKVQLSAAVLGARVAVLGSGYGGGKLRGNVRAEPTRMSGYASYYLSGGRFRLRVEASAAGLSYAKDFIDEDLGTKSGKLLDL